MTLTALVTRPAAQADEWLLRLRREGFLAQALPLLAIEPLRDTASLRTAWEELDRFAMLMFVSPNAVQCFFAARPEGRHWPASARAAAPGPGSLRALLAAGVPAAACVAPPAAPFDSAALWQQLRVEPWNGKSVLVVRGDGGRDEFAQALRGAGAQVEYLQAYSRQVPSWTTAEHLVARAALARPEAHVWLLSSGEAVGHLAQLLPHAHWLASTAVASHPRIAASAQRAGFGRVLPSEPTAEAIVQTLHTLAPRSTDDVSATGNGS